MSHPRLKHRWAATSVRFLISYLVVFGVMLGWWRLLQVSARFGAPVLTVLIAYAAPATAWAVIALLVGEKRHRA